MSIVWPSSRCLDCCGARIKDFDDVPLLSYLVLRGRCRICKAHLGPLPSRRADRGTGGSRSGEGFLDQSFPGRPGSEDRNGNGGTGGGKGNRGAGGEGAGGAGRGSNGNLFNSGGNLPVP
jgi:hypothetical protein